MEKLPNKINEESTKNWGVDELYEYVTQYLTPEQALKRMFSGGIEQYTQLKGLEGHNGHPEFIIIMAAMELGWVIGVESEECSKFVRGLIVGTEEYVNKLSKFI